MVKALVLMAEGFEEIELSCIVNILRRGGISVTTAGLENLLKNAEYIDKPVVEDQKIITSQGPGTAMSVLNFSPDLHPTDVSDFQSGG